MNGAGTRLLWAIEALHKVHVEWNWITWSSGTETEIIGESSLLISGQLAMMSDSAGETLYVSSGNHTGLTGNLRTSW